MLLLEIPARRVVVDRVVLQVLYDLFVGSLLLRVKRLHLIEHVAHERVVEPVEELRLACYDLTCVLVGFCRQGRFLLVDQLD